MYFPANTFYEDLYLNLEEGTDIVKVHDATAAAHRNFTLTFDVSKYSSAEKRNYSSQDYTKKNTPIYTKTYKKGESFAARIRNFGRYTLAVDSIAPTIKARNFKAKTWLSNYNYLSLTVNDEQSGIASYDGYINGKWILLEYEPKRNTLTYNFEDGIVTDTQCELKVIVTDNVGNQSTFETTFFRK